MYNNRDSLLQKILLIFYWLSFNNKFYVICYIKKTVWIIKSLKRCSKTLKDL